MTPLTVSAARSWLLLSGCAAGEVENVLADFLDGLEDDRRCMLGEPGSEDVPITSEELRDLWIEIVMRTALIQGQELSVAEEITTMQLRERMQWPSLSPKREQPRGFRCGRMVQQPEQDDAGPARPAC